MSVIIFELKEEHIKLLKFLKWSIMENNFIVSTTDVLEDKAPFDSDNLYEAMDLILNGRPENFNPYYVGEPIEYSPEQIAEWDKLYKELPTALEVILYTGSFKLGTYKTRWHDRNWIELQNKSVDINPKNEI